MLLDTEKCNSEGTEVL